MNDVYINIGCSPGTIIKPIFVHKISEVNNVVTFQEMHYSISPSNTPPFYYTPTFEKGYKGAVEKLSIHEFESNYIRFTDESYQCLTIYN